MYLQVENVPFWVVEELFLGDLVPKMLCKMQLRKKLLWLNWFYLILFYRYSQETWLERDAKKKKKNHMRRLKASVVTFLIGLLFPLIKQLQGSFPMLISEITPCKLAKKKSISNRNFDNEPRRSRSGIFPLDSSDDFDFSG